MKVKPGNRVSHNGLHGRVTSINGTVATVYFGTMDGERVERAVPVDDLNMESSPNAPSAT